MNGPTAFFVFSSSGFNGFYAAGGKVPVARRLRLIEGEGKTTKRRLTRRDLRVVG